MANVVLVVDMLKGFYNKGPLANPRVARIIPNIVKLLKNETAQGWKVYFLDDWHEENDKEFNRFPKHCVKWTEEAEIINELEKFSTPLNVIHKNRYSGFYRTDLDIVLGKEKPERIILVGVCTDICVLYTAADLVNRDYQVVIPWDCVETYDAPNHSAEEVSKFIQRHMVDVLKIIVYEHLY